MPGCEHKRAEFLMRRDGVDYVRCLDCDQVFESDDLEQVARLRRSRGRTATQESLLSAARPRPVHVPDWSSLRPQRGRSMSPEAGSPA